MLPHALLESLRNLLSSIPPLEGRGRYEEEQYAWLGRAKALIGEWDAIKSISFNLTVDRLIRNENRAADYGLTITFIHDVIAQLENALPQSSRQAFGPGAAYDFFVALNGLVGSANSQVFIVDPYLDAEVFDGYLNGIKPHVTVRLLTRRCIDSVRIALGKHRVQFGNNVEVRRSSSIHDRIIFVDSKQCWVLGSSIKDAALTKPTYLAPLTLDVATLKLGIYESIWGESEAI